VPAAAAHGLASRARRLFAKTGNEIVRFDRDRQPISAAEVEAYLVHEDGYLRVPVLVIDDVLVRGYTEALYDEALAHCGIRASSSER
jgi:hypothetical protein